MSCDETETIVIGSGFGGSITASRLAEAGAKVTLFERGPWWDTIPTRSMGVTKRTPFPRGLSLITRSVRSIDHPLLPWGKTQFNCLGLFELYFSKGMEVVCSSGVGGGSHVYSAVHRRPASLDYWDGWTDDLSEETMAPHYQSFIERVGSTKPEPHNRPPYTAPVVYANDKNFEAAIPKVDVRVGFLLPEDPRQPRMVTTSIGVHRHEADYKSGDHGFLGSPSGAKSSMDIVYLASGMKCGLQVYDLCEVISIEHIAKTGKRFQLHYYDHKNQRRKSIRSENLFIGAGTFNTLRLLLESRDKYKGLTGMPNLGHRFSGNGDIRGYWDLNEKNIDFTLGLPSKGAVVIKGAPEPRIAIGRNSMPSVSAYPLPRFMRDRLKRGLVVSGMGADAGDGVALMRGNRFHIEFNPANSPVYDKIYSTMQEMARLSGRKIYASRRPSTVHPMGGACVGKAGEGGVIGSNGQVHGIPGLYVVDAAAFPSPTASPPTMSIGAWAENVASRFLK
ncbi:GMC oxidoreductase [Brucella thiophenivorans]|nr:GMC oxidoreductase [Brucella thiophenivorans]